MPFNLGCNLNFYDSGSHAYIHSDAMRTGTPWAVDHAPPGDMENPFNIPGAPPVPVDAQGWPTDLTAIFAAGYVVTTAVYFHQKAPHVDHPTGIFRLIYDGDGEVTAHQGGNRVFRYAMPGVYWSVDVVPSENGILISITKSNPANPVRNIRLYPPGCDETQLLNPAFVKDMSPFSFLRFMDPMRTNASPVKTQADLIPGDYRSYTGASGMPVAAICAIGNALGKDIWINVPYGAADGCIAAMANVVREDLRRPLNVYVEYGNELWNSAGPNFYPAWKFVDDYSIAHGNMGHAQATGELTYGVHQIWLDVWGSEAGRVRKVATNQFVRPTAMQTQLDWMIRLDAGRMPGGPVDVIGGAPYLDWMPSAAYTADTTGHQIAVDYMAYAIPHVLPGLWQWAQLRDAYAQKLGRKIKLIHYEGGPGLVNKALSSSWYAAYVASGRDPAMGDAVLAYLDAVARSGADGIGYYSYAWPTDLGPAGSTGPWGACDFTGDTAAPKLAALRSWAPPAPLPAPVPTVTFSGFGAVSPKVIVTP